MKVKMMKDNKKTAKPFLRWAGGKTQLFDKIEAILPQDFGNEHYTYIEPFVGGGAVLFWILNQYPKMSLMIQNKSD